MIRVQTMIRSRWDACGAGKHLTDDSNYWERFTLHDLGDFCIAQIGNVTRVTQSETVSHL